MNYASILQYVLPATALVTKLSTDLSDSTKSPKAQAGAVFDDVIDTVLPIVQAHNPNHPELTELAGVLRGAIDDYVAKKK